MEAMEYTVIRLDGDYAYLRNDTKPEQEEKCVARALLPDTINEGTHLLYQFLQYSVIE